MHWIASTLCKVCIHSWHTLVAFDFFIGLVFSRKTMRKSEKKDPLYSIDCDLKMQEMAS